MNNDISFDLETLGIGPQALILSIGAVRFDRKTGELGPEFYRLIELNGLGASGVIDASTVVWWMQQNARAQADIFGKDLQRHSLPESLKDFRLFCEGAETYWQRGDKDAEWLGNAYQRCGVEAPWVFWELRDQRTLAVEFDHLVAKAPRGTAHNALADAKAQAVETINIFAVLQALGAV